MVQFKTTIGFSLSDTSQDATLASLLNAADQAVKRYCKRQSLETTVITEFPLLRGSGEALVLQEIPVLCYRLTGNITNGLPTITGLSSTSNLIVGMPAVLTPTPTSQTLQPFPNGATIASVDSATQVTMSGNATYSVTAGTILFGLSVWMDFAGAYGDGPGSQGSGPFSAQTLMLPGVDFALQRDQPDGTSKSGKLIRLGSAIGSLGMGGAWGVYGNFWSGMQGRGTLTTSLPPLWGKWPPGSVKVVYAAGLGYGAAAPSATQPTGGLLPTNTTIPADLSLAVNGLAAWLLSNSESGLLQVTSESFQGFSSSVAQAADALKTAPDLGSTRQLLSRFRKVSM